MNYCVDPTIQATAEAMSCMAMRGLALGEAEVNLGVGLRDFAPDMAAMSPFRGCRDHRLELELQAGLSPYKGGCVPYPPSKGVMQFETTAPAPYPPGQICLPRFLALTRDRSVVSGFCDK